MKITYRWNLINPQDNASLERYCHNCGRKVHFHDSKKRRHNANGKNIYEYAIYKCDRGHTWNLMLGKYKPSDDIASENVYSHADRGCTFNYLDLGQLRKNGINEIEIMLDDVIGKWRIDKLLGEFVRDLSRNKVCELIKNGYIVVDDKAVKSNYILKNHQIIGIRLD